MESIDEANNKKQKKKKSTWIAYLCWFIGGLFGFHLFYLRRDRHAFLHWFTLGGGFGVGFLRDFLKMRSYVANANSDPAYVKTVTDDMKKYKKPPFSINNFLKQLFVGYLFGMLFWLSIPNYEESSEDELDLTWLRCLSPIAIALGIHTYGNIDHEQGAMKGVVVSGFIALAFAYAFMDEVDGPTMLGFTSFIATSMFTWRSKQWKKFKTAKEQKHEAGLIRRILTLSVCGFVTIALLSSGIYFNLKVTDPTGQKVKFRDIASTLFNKQMYEQIIRGYNDFRNFYTAHGWEKVFDQVVDQFDFTHEDKARKVLGVPSNASKEMIVSRWRELSKEWHPDRHKDPAKKEEAQSKFMEFQAAYQTLVKIRGKFKAAKSKDEM